jgi:integrase
LTTGAGLWGEKFDGAVSDVFDFQDRMAESVVGVIEPTVRQTEIDRARRKHPSSLDAYDLFLRALPHTLRHSFATHLLEQHIDIRVIRSCSGMPSSNLTSLGKAGDTHRIQDRLAATRIL